MVSSGFLIMGTHLFPLSFLHSYQALPCLMIEDESLCRYVKYHKHKLIYTLTSMRLYCKALQEKDFSVKYVALKLNSENQDFFVALLEFIKKFNLSQIITFDIEDRFFEKKLKNFFTKHKVNWKIIPSPLFLNPIEDFQEYLNDSKPFLKTYYQRQRKKHNILIDEDFKPTGGQWSFDENNRKPVPAKLDIPDVPTIKNDYLELEIVKKLVDSFFKDHPGASKNFWLPVTRRDALSWMKNFFDHRFENFGSYQDAIHFKTPFLFHSVLACFINSGLITAKEVIEKALDRFENSDIALHSVEGFIRQILGWREFIRGIDSVYGEQQAQANHWNHHRKINDVWYTGDSGIPILDEVIQKLNIWGYSHHIERLMVVSNLMTLTEIYPKEAFRWFMEMHIDSAEWVMGPNVYGMGLGSDGGIFATKPYICSSNYLRKMSGAKKESWCDIVDGLYWRFIAKHRINFQKNPRMSMMVRQLEKIDSKRFSMLEKKAEIFIEQVSSI